MKNQNARILIITRHGEQCPEQGLTLHGETQVQQLCNTLTSACLKPDTIIASHPLRTQKSAGILAAQFRSAANRTEDFLNTYNFDMDGFLNSLCDNQRIVLIAAHEETIQCFGHLLLDDDDTGHFFDLLPDNRKTRHDYAEISAFLSCHMHHADALIIASDDTRTTGWTLKNLIIDGKIIAKPTDQRAEVQGHKFKALPDFPEILLALPE